MTGCGVGSRSGGSRSTINGAIREATVSRAGVTRWVGAMVEDMSVGAGRLEGQRRARGRQARAARPGGRKAGVEALVPAGDGVEVEEVADALASCLRESCAGVRIKGEKLGPGGGERLG